MQEFIPPQVLLLGDLILDRYYVVNKDDCLDEAFPTYEVEEKNIFPLLTKWQQKLESLVEGNSSNIYEIDIDPKRSDYDIFQQIKRLQGINAGSYHG